MERDEFRHDVLEDEGVRNVVDMVSSKHGGGGSRDGVSEEDSFIQRSGVSSAVGIPFRVSFDVCYGARLGD